MLMERANRNSFHFFSLSYNADGFQNRVNYYSNPSIKYQNIPTGDAKSNNAGLLTERRFIMSKVGDESMACYKRTEITSIRPKNIV